MRLTRRLHPIDSSGRLQQRAFFSMADAFPSTGTVEARQTRDLHRRLIIRGLLGLLLTSLLIGVVATWFLYSNRVQQLKQGVLLDVDLHVMTLESELSAFKSLAAQITSRSRIRQELEKYLRGDIDLKQLNDFSRPKLEDAMRLSADMLGIQRLGPQGGALIEVGLSIPRELWPRDYLQDDIRVGFPRRFNGQRLLSVSAPIINRQGQTVGFDIIVFSTENLTGIIRNFSDRDVESSMVQVVSVIDGRLESYFRPGDVPLWLDTDTLLAEALETLNGLQEEFHFLHMGGASISLVHRRIAGAEWVLFYLQETSEFLQPARATALIGVSTVVTLTLAGAIFTLLLVSPLARRISRQTNDLHGLLARNEKLLEDLRSSEGRLNSILDNATSAIFLKDLQGRYLLTNRRFLDMFGLRGDSLLGKRDRDVFSDEMAASFRQSEHFVIDHNRAQECDEQVVQSDGVHDLSSVRFPVADAQGVVYAVGGILTDVSERREAQRALEKSQDRYRNLVENTHDWIWEIDANGVYTYCSPRSWTFLGYEPDDIIGKTPFDLMPPAEANRVRRIFDDLVRRRAAFDSLEHVTLHRDGQTVVLETSAVPIFGEDGEFAGYRGADRDITARIRVQASP
jgi:PAS domain S-box-containing protein